MTVYLISSRHFCLSSLTNNCQEHVETLLWVGLGWLPDPHPAALSFPLLNKTGGENKMKKLIVQGKDQKIIY